MEREAEEWPMEWVDELDENAHAVAYDEFRTDVLAYAAQHGREATLRDYPNTEDVEAILNDYLS